MNGCDINQSSGITWENALQVMDYPYLQERPAETAKVYREALHDYEQEMAEFATAQDEDLKALRAVYVFEDLQGVESFLKYYRTVPSLLLETVPFLKRCFGGNIPLHLRVRFEEDGSRTLQALAIWNGTLQGAKNALAEFDREWWLQNCRRGSSNIILDYELV